MNMSRTHLGNFSQTSNKMAVSDPCYDLGTDKEIRGELEGVKPGTWNAYILKGDLEGWGNRVCELQIFHESTDAEAGYASTWMKIQDFEVGVDSGQAGFFDFEKYPFGNLGKYGEKGSFYNEACELTLESNRAGIIREFGAVSSSGVGDGCYDCFVMKNERDEIIGAKIIFIDSNEEDELSESSVE